MQEAIMNDEVVLSNGINLEIRDTTVEDSQGILEFLNTIKDESRIFMTLAQELPLHLEGISQYIDIFRKGKNDIGVVGIVDKEIIAIGRVLADSKNVCSHNGEIFVGVKREYWGKGVMRAIVNRMIEIAKQRTKLKNIIAILAVENGQIVEKYESMGFKKIGVYRNYYKIGRRYYHGIIMAISI